MWIFDLVLSILALLSFLAIGMVVDTYIFSKRIFTNKLPEYFGLGLGSVAIFGMAAAVFGIPITRVVVILFSLMSVAFLLFQRKFLRTFKKAIFRRIDITLAVVLSVFFAEVAIITFSHPVWGYDALEHWLARAHAFWVDNGMVWGNLHSYYQAEDPNLWPLAAAWLFHFLGKSSDFWVQIIPFAVLIGMVMEFAKRVLAVGKFGYFWLAIMAFAPFLWFTVASESYSGNADLMVSFFLFLGFGALFDKRYLHSVFFLAFAALSKNDALPAFIGICLLLPILRYWGREKVSALVLAAAFGLLFFELFWKYYLDLPSRYLRGDLQTVFEARPFGEYIKYSLHAFREEFRYIGRWGIGFFVIFYFLAVNARMIWRNKVFLAVLALIVVQFAAYNWVYYVTKEDQAGQIATSIFRLVSQLYPSVLLFAYVLWARDTKAVSR